MVLNVKCLLFDLLSIGHKRVVRVGALSFLFYSSYLIINSRSKFSLKLSETLGIAKEG